MAVFIALMLMWPSKSLEQKLPIKQNGVKNPNWGEETSWMFTRVFEDLNLGLPQTNPASGQGATWTRAPELQVQCSNHLATWHPQFTWAVALGGSIGWQGVGWEEASSQPLSLAALETKMATRWTYRKIGDCKQSMICSLSNNNNCFLD